MRLPNLFIVGAAKAGTTSLCNYAGEHPSIFMSPVKEPNFFCTDIDVKNFSRVYARHVDRDLDAYFAHNQLAKVHTAHISEWNQYLKLFRDATGEIVIGEGSVSYLYSRVAAQNIYSRIPDAKIVMSLRNPVDRAYSHYLMALNSGFTKASFREAVDQDMSRRKKGWGRSHLFVELGMYAEQVKRYLDIFPRDHVKIYLYDEFNNVGTLTKDLYRFLGVDDNFVPDLKVHNKVRTPKFVILNYELRRSRVINAIKRVLPPGVLRRFKAVLQNNDTAPKMSLEDRSYLLPFFAEDIGKLSRLIGRDLSIWLNSTGDLFPNGDRNE